MKKFGKFGGSKNRVSETYGRLKNKLNPFHSNAEVLEETGKKDPLGLCSPLAWEENNLPRYSMTRSVIQRELKGDVYRELHGGVDFEQLETCLADFLKDSKFPIPSSYSDHLSYLQAVAIDHDGAIRDIINHFSKKPDGVEAVDMLLTYLSLKHQKQGALPNLRYSMPDPNFSILSHKPYPEVKGLLADQTQRSINGYKNQIYATLGKKEPDEGECSGINTIINPPPLERSLRYYFKIIAEDVKEDAKKPKGLQKYDGVNTGPLEHYAINPIQFFNADGSLKITDDELADIIHTIKTYEYQNQHKSPKESSEAVDDLLKLCVLQREQAVLSIALTTSKPFGASNAAYAANFKTDIEDQEKEIRKQLKTPSGVRSPRVNINGSPDIIDLEKIVLPKYDLNPGLESQLIYYLSCIQDDISVASSPTTYSDSEKDAIDELLGFDHAGSVVSSNQSLQELRLFKDSTRDDHDRIIEIIKIIKKYENPSGGQQTAQSDGVDAFLRYLVTKEKQTRICEAPDFKKGETYTSKVQTEAGEFDRKVTNSIESINNKLRKGAKVAPPGTFQYQKSRLDSTLKHFSQMDAEAAKQTQEMKTGAKHTAIEGLSQEIHSKEIDKTRTVIKEGGVLSRLHGLKDQQAGRQTPLNHLRNLVDTSKPTSLSLKIGALDTEITQSQQRFYITTPAAPPGAAPVTDANKKTAIEWLTQDLYLKLQLKSLEKKLFELETKEKKESPAVKAILQPKIRTLKDRIAKQEIKMQTHNNTRPAGPTASDDLEKARKHLDNKNEKIKENLEAKVRLEEEQEFIAEDVNGAYQGLIDAKSDLHHLHNPQKLGAISDRKKYYSGIVEEALYPEEISKKIHALKEGKEDQERKKRLETLENELKEYKADPEKHYAGQSRHARMRVLEDRIAKQKAAMQAHKGGIRNTKPADKRSSPDAIYLPEFDLEGFQFKTDPSKEIKGFVNTTNEINPILTELYKLKDEIDNHEIGPKLAKERYEKLEQELRDKMAALHEASLHFDKETLGRHPKSRELMEGLSAINKELFQGPEFRCVTPDADYQNEDKVIIKEAFSYTVTKPGWMQNAMGGDPENYNFLPHGHKLLQHEVVGMSKGDVRRALEEFKKENEKTILESGHKLEDIKIQDWKDMTWFQKRMGNIPTDQNGFSVVGFSNKAMLEKWLDKKAGYWKQHNKPPAPPRTDIDTRGGAHMVYH